MTSRQEILASYNTILKDIGDMKDSQAAQVRLTEWSEALKNHDPNHLTNLLPSNDRTLLVNLSMLVDSLIIHSANETKYNHTFGDYSDWDWSKSSSPRYYNPYYQSYYTPYYYSQPTTVIFINNNNNNDAYSNRSQRKHANKVDKDLQIAILVCLLIELSPYIVYTMDWALKNLCDNLKEMCTELYHQQRVIANIASLLLLTVAVAGVLTFLATNPVGWGVAGTVIAATAVFFFCCGISALSSFIKNSVNAIDATVQTTTSLPGDSRFELKPSEERHLRANWKKQGLASDDIESNIARIKDSIKILATEVQHALIDNVTATQRLASLKKGNFLDTTLSIQKGFKIAYKNDPTPLDTDKPNASFPKK